MRTITLDGRRMDTIQNAHAYIEKKLEIHDYYGKNLDALWDILTGIGTGTRLEVIHFEAAETHLGYYAKKLRQVFIDAAVENTFLQVQFS
ncbi:barstar family protein [Eubacterium sp. 1001713B170207_170306_E7]|uniref:barstar family protein n=1 Tax=Eubacterium sp. 1001713B170207_170306_E7 TaxID=2787097 RepID=UPI0018994B27